VLNGDFGTNSLRASLLKDYGLRLVRAEQSIRALSANKEMAGMLSVKNGDPLLGIERVSFDQRNTPVEYLQIFYRSDRYVLQTELQG
jgi:GntR family transcriptional regulator